MPPHVILAARAITPMEEIADAAVVIEDGKITAVGRRDGVEVPKGAKEHDARQYTVVPGFVDIHIHGAGARCDGSIERCTGNGHGDGRQAWHHHTHRYYCKCAGG